jgi:integrase
MSALSWWHKVSGYGDLPRNGRWSRVRQGLHNVYGQFDKTEPAFALSLTQIYRFLPKLDLRSFDAARNWCATLFGFFGLLRVGEYTAISAKAVHLRVKHVSVTKEGLRLIVPFSKTSLTPHAVYICKRDDDLCPVAAYDYYLSFFRRSRSPDEPFFVTTPHLAAAHVSLAPDPFSRWLKQQAGRIGLPIDKVTGHSLRRGGTTALFIAGVSETIIARHGRWRSTCYRRYFDHQTPEYMATTILLQQSTAGTARFSSLSSSSSSSSSSTSSSTLPPVTLHYSVGMAGWIVPTQLEWLPDQRIR